MSMATFSQARPSAVIPTKFSIQYTTKVACPNAGGFPELIGVTFVCVSLFGTPPEKLIWNASEMSE